MALEFGVERKAFPPELFVGLIILWAATPLFMGIFYGFHLIEMGRGAESLSGFPSFAWAAITNCYELFFPPHFGMIVAPGYAIVASVVLPLLLMKLAPILRFRTALLLLAMVSGAACLWLAWVLNVAEAHGSWQWIKHGMVTATWELAPTGAVIGLIATVSFAKWALKQPLSNDG